MATQLTAHYHVIAIDLPTHGESNILIEQSYTIPEQAKRVVAVMDALHLIEPVHLMEHSMSGAIAYHVAVLAPEHVKSLALMRYSLDIETILPKIKLSTLIIWGDKDRVLDVSSTEVFKRLIPQAQLVIFKDIGHAPQLERTKETASAYQAFLAGVKQN